MQKILTFYPADIKPTIEHQYKTAILYNPCDGYHLAEWICFNHFTSLYVVVKEARA